LLRLQILEIEPQPAYRARSPIVYADLPRELDIGHVLRSLKALTMRLGIPMVAVGAVDDVGVPYAGEPHGRFDGRELETGSNGARASGDGRPRVTAGDERRVRSASGYRAGSLPLGEQAPTAILPVVG
jgi:hypothetical protein